MDFFKKLSIFGLIVATATILASCSVRRQEANDLVTNKGKWSVAKITNYRYTFAVGCWCPREMTSPVTIEVRNGVRTSLTRAKGIISSPKYFASFDTIEKVFQFTEKSINSKAEKVIVKYDSKLGYPISISVDESKRYVDDEIGYSITNFESP